MKRVLGLLLALGIMFAAIGGLTTARAADTDTFTITITCNFVEMTLKDVSDVDYVTWPIAQCDPSTPTTMTSAQAVVVDLGTTNVNTDVGCYVSAVTCSSGSITWSVATAIAEDEFKLEVQGYDGVQDPPDMATSTTVSAVLQDISGATKVSTDVYLYYKFSAPSTTTTGAEQGITVTVQGSIH